MFLRVRNRRSILIQFFFSREGEVNEIHPRQVIPFKFFSIFFLFFCGNWKSLRTVFFLCFIRLRLFARFLSSPSPLFFFSRFSKKTFSVVSLDWCIRMMWVSTTCNRFVKSRKGEVRNQRQRSRFFQEKEKKKLFFCPKINYHFFFLSSLCRFLVSQKRDETIFKRAYYSKCYLLSNQKPLGEPSAFKRNHAITTRLP